MNNLCHYPNACILLIEDDQKQNARLLAILKISGYSNIHICTDASAAISNYQRLDPDVVLLDSCRSKKRGFEILSDIREEHNSQYDPVIMIVADSSSSVKLKALTLGAKDFISKPFDELDVLARLNSVIDVKRMHKQLKSEKQNGGDEKSVLAYNLLHDELTGLKNKKLLHTCMVKAMSGDSSKTKCSSIILIYISNIKLINNSLGHDYGDTLLKEVAIKLEKITRKVCDAQNLIYDDLHLAYLSDNSFALGLTNLDSKNAAINLCKECIECLEVPYKLNNLIIELKFNVGLASSPEHGSTFDVLLQRADIAAYQAQEEKVNYCIYDTKYGEYAKYKVTLMQDLRIAMRDDVLELYFQPKVDLRNWQIYGFEALLRWNHPAYGFIPPDQFVAIAEETGLIGQLSSWVLTHGLDVQAKLKELGYVDNIAVNVTGSDLMNAKFITYLSDKLKSMNYTPNSLTLELTESTMIQDPDVVLKNIQFLKEKKVDISIDDFGTGYSSMAYLQKLSAGELKIDKSFVMDLASNQENQMIVKSIINLAHCLNMQVVAEGVEDKLSFELLNEFACDCIQGYWISRPIPYDELLIFIDSFDMATKKANIA